MNTSKLKYVLCPGSHPEKEFESIYNKIYNCWSSVWNDAYQEMKFNSKLYSDVFTRQDYIGALFYEDKCLALCFFRWADFSRPDFANDSYFSYWDKSDLEALTKKGTNIIISSNFTIHPLARKGNLDFSMKDLLTGISVEFFMKANADAMAANLRVDKKVNESCAKWGAELIKPNVHVSGGICGDLMVFYKEKVLSLEKMELDNDIENLWNQKMIINKKFNDSSDYFLGTNENINSKLKAA